MNLFYMIPPKRKQHQSDAAYMHLRHKDLFQAVKEGDNEFLSVYAPRSNHTLSAF